MGLKNKIRTRLVSFPLFKFNFIFLDTEHYLVHNVASLISTHRLETFKKIENVVTFIVASKQLLSSRQPAIAILLRKHRTHPAAKNHHLTTRHVLLLHRPLLTIQHVRHRLFKATMSPI